MNDRVQSKGISLASLCDCCIRKAPKNLNHILSIEEVAVEVWSHASIVMGVPFMKDWP